MIPRKSPFLLVITHILVVTLSVIASGCASQSTMGDIGSLPMIPLEQLPGEVRSSPRVVQEAYQFAIANPEILKQLPCYCGCGEMGHTSNYSCYANETNTGGEFSFDNHALGCSICVDITQDAMRLLQDGKTLQEIRAYVDETYSQYGPSNIPPAE